MVITEEGLKELASRRGTPVVTSLYLDVDGRRYPKLSDAEPYLDQLVRKARELAREREVPSQEIERQLDQIVTRFRQGFDRSTTRGVAFFASGSSLEVIEVPRPVHNQVVLNQAPVVRQLEYLLDEYQGFVVVLVDRQRVRLFRFELGELVERTERFDPVPPRVDGTDDGGLMASHVQSHADEVARRHLRHAADLAGREVDDWSAQRVILGGPKAAVAEFEELLRPAVRDRVVAHISVAVQAPEDEIREAALEIEHEAERRHEAEVVHELQESLGSEQRGVAGLEDTLRALYERRVDLLIVSVGFEAPGWRCEACGYLSERGSTCPMCEGGMARVDDLVSEAIDQALLTNSRVETCENADLDVLGRIGALLRF